MGVQDDAEWFEPDGVAAWSRWLADHHADVPGVWLVTAKRSSGRQVLDYETAIVEALRYGWVDSTQRGVDEERTRLWFAPRRPTSGWARTNKARIARLEAEGRLEAAGRAAVEAAKANGSWELYDDVEALVVPDDLAAAFDAHPGSRAHWDGFAPSARKQMLAWVVTAKQSATRERRVTTVAAKAAAGVRALP